MTEKKTQDGRRSMELRFEVPGSPEDVWQAIATGPGISAWFTPSEVDERVGGKVTFQMGGGMESTGSVTIWQPNELFAYEEPTWLEGAPPLATEFHIQAQSGGTCIIRLVHSLFTDSQEWDEQFDGFAKGWPPYFEVLRRYLADYRGLVCSSVRLMGTSNKSEEAAWMELRQLLGIAGKTPGEAYQTQIADREVRGEVLRTATDPNSFCEALLRVTEPAPGLAVVGACLWGGNVQVALGFFFYGDRGATVVPAIQVKFEAWMSEHYPAAGSENA
jgi:uncharacterized protein YndB with AHSA1/START domain